MGLPPRYPPCSHGIRLSPDMKRPRRHTLTTWLDQVISDSYMAVFCRILWLYDSCITWYTDDFCRNVRLL